MGEETPAHCVAFEGSRCIASGNVAEVARKVKEVLDRGEREPILIFDDLSSELVEIDFRGTMEDVLKRLEPAITRGESDATKPGAEKVLQRGPGRPKLGVVAREVTLLPRHWEWLNDQPGGASVALRKLVEQAKRVNRDRDQIRHAQEATYRFMSAIAGNLPAFEEAARALFAGDSKRFNSLVASWPRDIRNHSLKLIEAALPRDVGAGLKS